MSTPMTFQNRANIKPPQKGSFPIDHDGECKEFMKKYMSCLKGNKLNNEACRLEAKDYLGCRMDKNLMKKEDWKKLGYKDLEESQ